MLEHDLHHLGEILVQQRCDVIRPHRLGHGRETTDVTEENHHRPLGASQLHRTLLTRDLLGDVGCEVPLEVGYNYGFTLNTIQ